MNALIRAWWRKVPFGIKAAALTLVVFVAVTASARALTALQQRARPATAHAVAAPAQSHARISARPARAAVRAIPSAHAAVAHVARTQAQPVPAAASRTIHRVAPKRGARPLVPSVRSALEHTPPELARVLVPVAR